MTQALRQRDRRASLIVSGSRAASQRRDAAHTVIARRGRGMPRPDGSATAWHRRNLPIRVRQRASASAQRAGVMTALHQVACFVSMTIYRSARMRVGRLRTRYAHGSRT